MENNKKYSPSRKQIAEYWKDKYISKDFKIIDFYEEGAEPVITDPGEPECWACAMFNHRIYDNPNYDRLINTNNYMRIWNFPEVRYLQKAHIKSKMLGGENIPSNYFLLCKECHQESPDFVDNRYFYAYIRYVRKNAYKISKRRNKKMMQAIYEMAYQMNKNILTVDKGFEKIPLVSKKMGLHITSFSLYTHAAAVVDSMDELNLKQLSKEDYNKMQSEFSKYDIYVDF